MQKNPHFLRRLRRFIFYSMAAGIVLLAVLMSVLRVVVSEADSWRMELQQLGADYLERQIYIEALDARLDGLTPVLVLKNVRLMSTDGKTELLSFSEATLELDIIGSIKAQAFIPTEFTIQGAEFTVVRHRDRSFSFQGMELKNTADITGDTDRSDELTDWLFQRADLNVRDSTVIWIDQASDQPELRLEKVNIHLHNDGNHHQLKASLELPETLGRSFDFALDARGKVAAKLSDWRGKLYLHGNGVHVARLGIIPAIHDYRLLGGVADFELWGEWNRSRVERLSGELTAYNLDIRHPDMGKPLKLKLLGGLFDYRFGNDDWALNINRFHFVNGQGAWPETNISIYQRSQSSSNYKLTQVQTDRFRLENLSNLLLGAAVLSKEQTDLLMSMQPSADVENFLFRFSDNPNNHEIKLQARFFQLGFQPWKKIPGVHGLNGELSGNHEQMLLNVNSDYAVFNFPELFRDPLKISSLSGVFAAQRYRQGWQLSTDSLLLKNEDIETHSSVLLDIPDNAASPFMDLQVHFKNGNAARASSYYPVGIMSQGLVDWLDRGIVSGRIIQGGAVFQGRLGDFPFKQNEGQLRVEFEADDARIDYLAGWPAVHDAQLNAVFSERGMDIQSDAGRILDSRLSATTIRIEDFQYPDLAITGEVKGEVKDALRFLVESPIQPQAKSLIDSFHYHGSSQVDLDLSIPLDDEVEKTQPLAVKGRVHLRDAELLMLDDLIDISAINGTISFTENSQSATGIRARIMGGEATLDVRTGDKEEGRPVIIAAKGTIDSQHLAQKFGLPAHAQVNGITDWRGSLTIPRDIQGKTVMPVLRIQSLLNGVEVNLPPPLAKAKEEQRDTLLEVRFGNDGQTMLYTRLLNYFSGAVVLNTNSTPMQPLKAYIHFGAGEGRMPETDSLRLSGSLSMFRLAPWIDALKQGRDEVTRSFVSLPLVFDMTSLQLAPVGDKPDSAPSKQPPLKLDADLFPLIQGSIERLSYDDVLIGRIDIRTSRLKLRKGIRLDSLSLQGEQLNMQASGEWVQWPNRDSSSMEVKLDSPDLGKMLSSLGFSAIFEGGKTTLGGTLYWPDTPMGVSLSGIEAKLKYTVKDGSIISVEPGAGRLLGLFSLAALPRRLMLDFSDAFGEGLHFDSIEGELDIHDGSVFMENNLMKSPLATIFISGRTGLVKRDFDQLVTVNPRGGDALTAVAGGMIFGPQIGAAILLIQKILGNELKDVTAIRYKVTGSWEKPVITRLDKPKTDESSSLEEDEF